MSDSAGPTIDRRRFLAAAAALPLARALDAGPSAKGGTPAWSRFASAAGGPGGAGEAVDGLPPRVVGLRTSGGNFRFDPVGLLLEPGTTLPWLNMGDFHTTTAFHPANAGLVGGDLPLRIPQGAAPWHSGMLGLTAGTRFEHTFEVEGVHDYFCQPHYGFGMVGRIVVGGPRGGAGTRPLDGLPDAAREKMPSVERITGDAGRSFEWAARLNGVLDLLAAGSGADAAARAVADGIAGDDALKRHLGSRHAAAGEEAARFAEEVASGTDYESLVAGADRVKAAL